MAAAVETAGQFVHPVTVPAAEAHFDVIAVFLEDTIFSFAVCFVLQVDAWSFCNGALCWQHFCGIWLGLLLWLLTAGRLTAAFLRRIRMLRNRISRLLRCLFCRPANPEEKISESP